jgi:hypothetical protein
VAVRTVQFFAIIVGALALIPSGAHLAALLNKIDLPQADYFTVQAIYHRWAFLGLLWPVAIIMNVSLAILVRSQRGSFRVASLAALCFGVMLAIFFVWTQPANQATQNWTMAPGNWETLRYQWEYSHAVNAMIVFIAFCFTTLSVLVWRSPLIDSC